MVCILAALLVYWMAVLSDLQTDALLAGMWVDQKVELTADQMVKMKVEKLVRKQVFYLVAQ